MLLRHTLTYAFAKGVPSLIGFATLAIFTRVLSPELYGKYMLILTIATISNAIFFHWIEAAMLRHLSDGRGYVLEHIKPIFACVCIFFVGVAGLLLKVIPELVSTGLILAGVSVTIAQALYAINLELLRSNLMPMLYGVIGTIRSLMALGLGVFLIQRGYGVDGAILGLIIGYFTSAMISGWGRWRLLSPWRLEPTYVKKLLIFGLPLAASFTTSVVIFGTDRIMLAAMIDTTATGLYSAAQGLAQQAVGVIMTIVGLATYPLILKIHKEGSKADTQQQLRNSAVLLIAAGLPITLIFLLFSDQLASIFLGQQFQTQVPQIMPLLAVAAMLSGIRVYYVDISFSLAKQTKIQMSIMFLAALLNITLNLFLIPAYGIMGAVLASLLSHFTATMLSWYLSRFAYELPEIRRDLVRLMAATGLVTLLFSVLPKSLTNGGAVIAIFAGSVAYAASCAIVYWNELRPIVSGFLSNKTG